MRAAVSLFIFFGLMGQCAPSAAQMAVRPDTNGLRILSWNIYMLPGLVYSSTSKRARADGIAEELSRSGHNIIVFQEAFQANARRRLYRKLKHRYPYRYGPANSSGLYFRTNSGIWVISDRPLRPVAQLQYRDCTGDGCFARKGMYMLEGEHDGHTFQITGTHNNGGEVNDLQFKQVRTEMLDPYRRPGVPQIICGDFNTKMTSKDNQWQLMLTQFDADTTLLVQQDGRSTEHRNTMPITDVYHRFPDFIFIRRNGDDALKLSRLSTISYGPTWVQGPAKKVFGTTVGYSDHYPVEAIIVWE